MASVHEARPEKSKLMVAHFINRHEASAEFEVWPVHITMLHWFEVESEEEAADRLRRSQEIIGRTGIAERNNSLIADRFDVRPEGEVRVRDVFSSGPLKVVHGILMATFGYEMESTRNYGANYHPYAPVNTVDPGRVSFTLDTLSLIKFHEGTPRREILEEIAF